MSDFFAGINSSSGYAPYMEELFCDAEKLFIIKGSSGCGKSTVMKRVALKAEARGYEVDYIYCSADPDSLDGIYIKTLGIAIADGTFPHVMEPKKYGIRERTVSLESTFDYDRLEFFSQRLSKLIDVKSTYMKAASSLIASTKGMEDARSRLTASMILDAKLKEFCAKFISKHTKKGCGKQKIAPVLAICRKGIIYKDTFKNCQNKYIVTDRFGISHNILEEMAVQARLAVADSLIIPSPIDKNVLCGIYFPSTDTVLMSDRFIELEEGKKINGCLFIDPEIQSIFRKQLTDIKKLFTLTLDSAVYSFKKSFDIHLEIEKIYSECVDFSKTDAITQNLLQEIF